VPPTIHREAFYRTGVWGAVQGGEPGLVALVEMGTPPDNPFGLVPKKPSPLQHCDIATLASMTEVDLSLHCWNLPTMEGLFWLNQLPKLTSLTLNNLDLSWNKPVAYAGRVPTCEGVKVASPALCPEKNIRVAGACLGCLGTHCPPSPMHTPPQVLASLRLTSLTLHSVEDFGGELGHGSGYGLDPICRITTLTFLDLSFNDANVINDDFHELRRLINLRTLRLDGTCGDQPGSTPALPIDSLAHHQTTPSPRRV
jgi:hypothetical protein